MFISFRCDINNSCSGGATMTQPPNRKATDSFFLFIFSDCLFFPLILFGNGQVTTSSTKPYSTEVSQVVHLLQDGTSIHDMSESLLSPMTPLQGHGKYGCWGCCSTLCCKRHTSQHLRPNATKQINMLKHFKYYSCHIRNV